MLILNSPSYLTIILLYMLLFYSINPIILLFYIFIKKNKCLIDLFINFFFIFILFYFILLYFILFYFIIIIIINVYCFYLCFNILNSIIITYKKYYYIKYLITCCREICVSFIFWDSFRKF